MQVIQKQKTTTYEIYVATDGTEFYNIEECRKYEESAKGMLSTKYRDMCVLKSISEYNLYECGSEEYTIDVVKVETSEAVDLVLQLLILYKGNRGDTEARRRNWLHQLQECQTNNSVLLIGRGYDCDDDFTLLGDLNSKLNQIKTNSLN